MRLVLSVMLAMSACGLVVGCEEVQRQVAVNHYVNGQILAEQGNTEAALAELALALKNNPRLDVAHATIGDIHRNRGDFEAARASYEQACKINPYAFRPHYNLGVTYQMLAAGARNVTQMEEQLFRAVSIYLRAVTLEPADFETNLNLSACYFQLGKYDLAEQYCLAAIRLNNDSPQAYSNLGIIYDSQNRLNDAIMAFRNSLDIDTQQPRLLLNMGSTYMRQGLHKQAMHCFDLALRQDATLAAAYELMGTCLFHMKEYPQSLEAYERALLLDSQSAIAYRGLGVTYMSQFVLDKSKTECRDKAIAAWRRSLSIEPDQNDLIRLIERYEPVAPSRL
ncbi:MAG: tetratricopeptide repeat protein [Planctomycetes bacterium]|jgi:tetratricopeptide (TPR) repeat protein|nr:tetratricopeptide repeat protein [Planctomycetota bacterium]